MHDTEQAGAEGGDHRRPTQPRHVDDSAAENDGRPRLAFIGAGRVATVLAIAFQRAGWQVTAVASRDEARRAAFSRHVPAARAFAEPHAVLDDADLVFLTVPDDAIAPVAATLRLYSGQALVHTSGALPAAVVAPALAAGTSAASFHPLVAFADPERALADLVGATIALEGDESLLPLLAEMAESIGAVPVLLSTEGKPAYHAAAMLAAGGLIGLLDAIAELGASAGLDERTSLGVYAPLVRQALANAEQLGPGRALTGPFVRGDVGTVAAHLAALGRLAPGALPLYLAVAERELALAERDERLPAERSAALRQLLADARAG